MSIEDPVIEVFQVNGFVKIAAVFLLGLMLLSGFCFAISNDNPRPTTISMTGIPSPGDTVTMGAHVFEFTNTGSVAAGHIPVTIGSTIYESGTNLKNALQANTDFTIQSSVY
jgi:hypothetical protein